jgi:hypothetical protein
VLDLLFDTQEDLILIRNLLAGRLPERDDLTG